MKVIVGFMLLAVLGVVSAHLCLLNPLQRGSVPDDLDKPGVQGCSKREGPCGGMDIEDPHIIYFEGAIVTVIFQKNLDHWVKATPGLFHIAINIEDDWIEVAQVEDKGEPSLTLYTVNFTVPKMPSKDARGLGILQVIYETKNPDALPMFYQCSDLYIRPQNEAAGRRSKFEPWLKNQP